MESEDIIFATIFLLVTVGIRCLFRASDLRVRWIGKEFNIWRSRKLDYTTRRVLQLGDSLAQVRFQHLTRRGFLGRDRKMPGHRF